MHPRLVQKRMPQPQIREGKKVRDAILSPPETEIRNNEHKLQLRERAYLNKIWATVEQSTLWTFNEETG